LNLTGLTEALADNSRRIKWVVGCESIYAKLRLKADIIDMIYMIDMIDI
jgi:hypothetical protein